MAGDCPHGAHLEASLKHHHHEDVNDATTVIIPTNHERYLQIIDELKNDLDQMSCEVVKVQNECWSQDTCVQKDDVDLTTSLKELETQNDRLEEALKLQTQAKEIAYNQLETNNQTLKCQIDHLKNAVREREQRITQLTTILHSISQKPQIESCPANAAVECYDAPSTTAICCNCSKRIAELEKRLETLSTELDKSQRHEYFLHSETRKLNKELNDSRRKNGDLAAQAHRLATLLKSQENHRMELTKKYDELEKNSDEQTKQLRAANTQLSCLNERFKLMERSQNEHNMERDLLRQEVIALKEKEAVVMGRQKSMQEHLLKTEKELDHAHDVIKEQKSIMHSNDVAHSDELRRLKDENWEIKRKLKNLLEDYKQLKEAYEKECELCKQSEKLIESYRKWKESQLFAEKKTRESFKQFEEYIHLLLKDKKELLNEHRELRQNYQTLEMELDRLRNCSFSASNPQLGQFLSERSIAERLEFIRQTKNRISEQCSLLQQEQRAVTPPPSNRRKSTSDNPSNETL